MKKRDSKTQRLVTPVSYTVKLPDSGSNGNAVPLLLGATLLIVYRTPRQCPRCDRLAVQRRLRHRHAHDGWIRFCEVFIRHRRQSIGEVAVIVGNGSSKFSEQLLFNGQPLGGLNPFFGREGEAWTTRRFLSPIGSAVTRHLLPSASTTTGFRRSIACPAAFSHSARPCRTPTVMDCSTSGRTPRYVTPRLRLATTSLIWENADKNHKDLYVEINALVGSDHTHLPSPFVLKLVGDAFRKAPPGRRSRALRHGQQLRPCRSCAGTSTHPSAT